MNPRNHGWLSRLSDFDIKFGPWLNYDKTKYGEQMNELISESWSPFNGCDIAQVFIYCMAHAYARGKSPGKPSSSGGGSMPASAFKRDMRDFMKALAVAHDGKLDVIADPKRVVEIGEGYAFAGFPEIYDRIKNRNSDISPEQILDQILREITDMHDAINENQP